MRMIRNKNHANVVYLRAWPSSATPCLQYIEQLLAPLLYYRTYEKIVLILPSISTQRILTHT